MMNSQSFDSKTRLDPSLELLRRWQQDMQPDIVAFAAELDVRGADQLATIARVDLRQRWRHGHPCEAEDYFARLPELMMDPERAVDLIFAEYLIREELGDDPVVSEYQQRFPEYAEELQAQIELHCALQSGEAAVPPIERDPGSDFRQPLFFRARTTDQGPAIAFDYEVLDEIGRGGTAVVYRARQRSLNRLVALKMVRVFDYASDELLDRFKAEAETIARLHHPQIVQIFDYGDHAGSPFLALELVEGTTLANLLRGNPWPARHAAQLIAALARTIEFAHEHGIVHRDLKPANILVPQAQVASNQTTSSGRLPVSPNRDCGSSDVSAIDPRLTKITDFGLAKLLDAEQGTHTQTGAILGTPAYMAPEQITGRTHQIGPATDIYALGAILYELLTGRPPFRSDSALETLRQVVNEEPVSLWRLQSRVSRDLATICSKCLCKEPRQRYQSAVELADDLQRFLDDRPILARPTSSFDHTWRWCRRNPALAFLSATVTALLLTVATVSTVLTVQLKTELGRTEKAELSERQAKDSAQLRLFESYLMEMSARSNSRQIGQRFSVLETVNKAKVVLEEIGRIGDRELRLRNAAIAAFSLADLRRLRPVAGRPQTLTNLAFSATGDRYVVSTISGSLLVYRLSDGKELFTLDHSGLDVVPLISQDGRYVAASNGQTSKLWRIDGTTPSVAWQAEGASRLTLSPDNRYAAVSGPGEQMRLLDLTTGETIRQLGRGSAKTRFAFHLPSQRVAVVSTQGMLIMSLNSGEVLLELKPPASGNSLYPSLSWHPGGQYLAVAGYDDGVALWDTTSGQRIKTYPQLGSAVHLHFVGEGDLLLTADSWTGNVHLWQTTTGNLLVSDSSFPHFDTDVTTDGIQLLLVLEDEGLALWQVEPAYASRRFPHSVYDSLGAPCSADISPDGRLLAIGREQGVEIFDLLNHARACFELSRKCFSKFLADGSLVVHCDAGIFRWPSRIVSANDGSTCERDADVVEVRFGPPEKIYGPALDIKFDLAADGSRLIARGPQGWQTVESASTSSPLTLGPQADPRVVDLNATGTWVAMGSWNRPGASVYDARNGARIVDLPAGAQVAVLFSPDNRYLITSPYGVQAWHTDTWRRASQFQARGRTANGLGLAFSPDSRALAIGQPTGEVRLADPNTGKDWATIIHPELRPASFLAFSPDQSRFVVLSFDSDAIPYVWNLTGLRSELAQLGLDWPANILEHRRGKVDDLTNATSLTVSFDVGSLTSTVEAAAQGP